MPTTMEATIRLTSAKRYIWLSVAAAITTIILKFAAWWLSDSVGLLSDALESFVNLAGALFALSMLNVANTPPDPEHPFGHNKAEYFSSGFEGTLIFIAAASILVTAIPRLIHPQPLESLGIGMWFSVASTVVNFFVSRVLARAARRLHSVVLEADAAHLMTDVWTSIGVLLGLIAFMVTGWLWLDAVIAIAVALHILSEGWKLMRGAINGLMDPALDHDEVTQIERILGSYAERNIVYANLKTRRAGTQRFVSVTVMVPGEWTVEGAHQLLDEIEERIAHEVHGAQTFTHLEPAYCVVGTSSASRYM